MAERGFIDVELHDVLHEGTRRDRRALLGASTLALLVSLSGAIPTRISALGIDFSPDQVQVLKWVSVAVVAYLTFAFAVHAYGDLIGYRFHLISSAQQRLDHFAAQKGDHTDALYHAFFQNLLQNLRSATWFARLHHAVVARLALELLLPIVLGVSASALLPVARFGCPLSAA